MDDQVKMSVEPPLARKLAAARERLGAAGGVVVALSGGVDSSLVAALAVEALGRHKVVAAHARGPIFPRREDAQAQQVARQLGVELVQLDVSPVESPAFANNPPDRCYHCKRAVFGVLRELAERRGLPAVASGANADDPGDHRPGLRAESELGVLQPLRQAGMTKADIRAAAAAMALPTRDAPSSACLASRVPYGQPITLQRLARIDRAEEALHRMGFVQCRVRDHQTVARVEVLPADMPAAMDRRQDIVEALRAAGYAYVALDLSGFRSGSMNEVL